MKLQEKLNAMKEESNASRPPEVVAVMVGEVEKLVQSGIDENAIKTGERLPPFTLPDEKENSVHSADLLSSGPLAISFYRGVW